MAACRIGRLRSRDLGAARDGLLALLGDDAAVEGKLCRDYENRRRGGETGSTPGREAALALEDVGASAIEPLVGVLESGSGVARENAALALGLIEDEQAIDALAAALSDELDAVRARAAWSLGMIEDAAAGRRALVRGELDGGSRSEVKKWPDSMLSPAADRIPVSAENSCG